MDPITIMTTIAKTPIIQSLVKELFIPKFKSFIKPLFDKTDELLNLHEAYYTLYLDRMYKTHSYVNTKTIPNSQIKLNDVYIAQTIILDRDNHFKSDEETIKIEKIPVELIKKYKKILIKDSVGMGKSTIMKYMFLNLIDEHIIDLGIPIYIELSQLTDTNTIINEIHNELNSLSKEFDADKLYKFIQNGGFIFFLDGYDEISYNYKAEVTNDIRKFISKASNAPNNYFIMTSRSEERLNSFGAFQKFKIKPLTRHETIDLLSNYDLSENKKDSKALIAELDTGKYKSIDDCLKNPLLVSLLFYIFKNHEGTTLDLYSFYCEIYETFFNEQDLSKCIKPHERTSGIRNDDLDQILRFVGYMCLISENEKEEFNKDDIIGFIKKTKNNCRKTDFNESDCLNDLLFAVPFFYKQGGKYKWVYKSFMDYFAARYIALDAIEIQDEILNRIYHSKNICRYINMLNIYYYVDNIGFSKNIMQSLCDSYILYYTKNRKKLMISSSNAENRVGLLFHFDQVKFGIVNKNNHKLKEKEEIPSNENNTLLTRSNKHLSSTYDAYIYTKVNNNHFILSFLYEKNPSLYTTINIKKTFDNLEDALSKYYIKEFKNSNSLIDINFRTGDNCEDAYLYVNELLYESRKSNPLIMPLDYNACISEIEKIKQRTDPNESSTFILPK